MAFEGDPYRTLGLARGASLDEVKRAYRRLAKANHPDAAGPGALPRFLAIQTAYEQLAGQAPTQNSKRRESGASSKRASTSAQERAEATRRAYGGRPRGRSKASGAATGPPPAEGPTGRPGKATFGSTSYDGADAGPFEPDWRGASWYGTTSGTYWTLNPKEYADPRKHGPEYLARAKRSPRARSGPGQTSQEPSNVNDPDLAPQERADPTHGAASWWDATSGSAAVPDPGPAEARTSLASDLVRALTDPGIGGVRGRSLRGFVGWLPIALGLGWLAGEVTGCGRFAATCDSSAAAAVLGLQGGALIALLLVPQLASLAASGTVALLVAAVAATLILSATGSAADLGSRQATLAVLLVAAWLVGLSMAIGQRARRAWAAHQHSGPVS